MSNFGYDYPIFNWSYSSDPLGTILDSPDLLGDQIFDWDLTASEDSLFSPLQFQKMIEQLPPQYHPPAQVAAGTQLTMNTLATNTQSYPYSPMIPISNPAFDHPQSSSSPSPSPPPSPPLTSLHSYPIHPTNHSEDFYVDEDFPSSEENEIFEKELSKVKLQASKSPIMDALVYCALNRWGIVLLEENGDNIRFRVLNFQKYYKYSAMICAKQNPTEDIASRIKALKRWFPDFPTKRAGNLDDAFEITVQLPNKQDNKPQKLHEIIEKQRKLLGVQKISRQT